MLPAALEHSMVFHVTAAAAIVARPHVEELQYVAHAFAVPLCHQLDRQAPRKGTNRFGRTNHAVASPIACNADSISGG
jgi:hypothetical protein